MPLLLVRRHAAQVNAMGGVDLQQESSSIGVEWAFSRTAIKPGCPSLACEQQLRQ